MKRNRNLYCQYHQEPGHTNEDCRNLRNNLDQLVREEKLKHLLHHSNVQQGQTHPEPQRETSLRPPIGIINVIFAASGRTGSCPFRVMSVAQLSAEGYNPELKRARVDVPPILCFLEEDKVGTIQPHDNALVITFRIGGYDVKRVMVDDGSGAEIMYLDLYKGLKLRPKDLTSYNSPLVSFDGKIVIPKGQIRLPVQTGPEVVEVDFIMVDTYSLYENRIYSSVK